VGFADTHGAAQTQERNQLATGGQALQPDVAMKAHGTPKTGERTT
jgi:hypothetical protein